MVNSLNNFFRFSQCSTFGVTNTVVIIIIIIIIIIMMMMMMMMMMISSKHRRRVKTRVAYVLACLLPVVVVTCPETLDRVVGLSSHGGRA